MYQLKILLAAFFLGLTPQVAAAAPFDYDASAQLGSISFSESQLFAGEQVRVYGSLVNLGEKDIRGNVRFYQGAIGLGDLQFFSLKAQSASEDFWVDWRPVEGTYNISMTIESTDPLDQNPANNTAVTALMTITKRPPPPPPPAPTPAPSVASPQLPQSPQTSKKIESAPVQVQKVNDSVASKKGATTTSKKISATTQKQGVTSAADQDSSQGTSQEIVTQFGDEATSDVVDVTKPVPFARVYPPAAPPGMDNGKKLIFLLTGFAGLSLVFGGIFWGLSKKEE